MKAYRLALCAILILAVASLAGAAAKTKIRATVWLGDAELKALGSMTDAYLKMHPNADVEWINIVGGGNYGRDKLQTMIAGGDAPDLMMLNTGQFEQLASRGALKPLDDIIKGEKFDLSLYWPQAIGGISYQGKIYGLPRDMSNVILYYNKDLFDKSGVAYPNNNWTWNDLLAAAKKLTLDTNHDGKIDQWGFAVNNIVWVWAGFVWGNGGDILNADRTKVLLNDPNTIDALNFYFGLLTKEHVSPPPGALPEQSWAGDWMLTQNVAMGLFGPWWRPSLVTMDKPFRWDVAYPPKSPKTGKRGSVVYTDMWGMSSSTGIQAQTWDFMKYLTSKDGQQLWTDLIGARSISPVKSVAQSDKWLHYGGSTGEIILDSLSFSQVPPINFGNGNEVETIWDQEFGAVIAGQQTVEQAVAKIIPQVQAVLSGN
ncbi:MAG TPA: sugar ABC transporter substrate-binding protein [Spirochaetia bacterium]|nr:sugar ABC transporter substrate-binding protein [Spirochaetia bacterium]